ncbi:hypothetical protein L596_019981 [Steinernema carpocapsae]|uniref:Uncharacterized protein n=1 Tax=Steinernema carpocapsae TaxID=34508 RepID=A0A4U5MS88_STECR|nr:hypothetical protein L596_019981 [Steinernema carpocapsae]
MVLGRKMTKVKQNINFVCQFLNPNRVACTPQVAQQRQKNTKTCFRAHPIIPGYCALIRGLHIRNRGMTFGGGEIKDWFLRSDGIAIRIDSN